MEVKIQCDCGTRFAFEVEPVNGRMPVRVKCPECGADGTDQANEYIRQKLGAAAAPVPQTPPAPARQPVRMAVPQPAAAPVAAAAPVTFCPRHLKNPAVDACRVCGKPICEECMETYGYACSTFCRKRAEETGIELPVYAKQRAVIEARVARVGKVVWRATILLVVVVVGTWVWYTFFGSRPRVIYSESLPHGDRARFYRFLAPGQVLTVKANQMSLFDLAQQKRLWSVPLNVGFSTPPPPDPSVPNIEEEVELYPTPYIAATTNDLWFLIPGNPGRLVQYDRRSGNSKQEIPLNPPFFGLAESDSGITVIASDESGRRAVTRIKFAGGTVQTEPIESTARVPPTDQQPKIAGNTLSTNDPGYAKLGKLAALAKLAMLGKPAKPEEQTNWDDKFIADGTGVVQMKVDLIERKTITHQAMKQQKKSLIDDNLTAGQSLEAVEREMNEVQREQTGGVEEEDVSRYQVTLRRLPAGTAPDWKGEAIGLPSFYPLKTLGVLVSGKTIQVFDRNNRRLWGANLTYPVASRYLQPCLEASNTLYVFDRGMLTSFEAATGAVRWRLTSVGISRIQLDDRNNLYVSSTTASPDAIQFSQQVELSSKTGPVILKVDAATGKVLWRNENVGGTCYVSGKYVYTFHVASNLATVGEDPILYFDMYRLSPVDGHPLWDYAQSRLPVQIDVQDNEIMIHFRGELQVLKFLSL